VGVSQKPYGNSEYVLSLDLKTNSESALIIVSGNKFQTVGAEQQKARLAKYVLVNGLCDPDDAKCPYTDASIVNAFLARKLEHCVGCDF